MFVRGSLCVLSVVVACLLKETAEAAVTFPDTFAEVFERFSDLDTSLKRKVVRMSIVYPKTKSLGEEQAVAEAEYDGSVESFRRACAALNEEVELKARGTDLVVNEILDTLKDEDFFKDVGADVVDGIVLHRFLGHVVRLRRVPLHQGKHEGRVLFIELNDVRQHAVNQFTATKSVLFEYAVAWIFQVGLWIGVGAVSLSALIPYGVWLFKKLKRD